VQHQLQDINHRKCHGGWSTAARSWGRGGGGGRG
jgi:hypothetical protein